MTNVVAADVIETLPPWSLTVDMASMAIWATALRDANPIHVDPAVAEAMGYGPRTVNPGPANLAYVLNMVMAAHPAATLIEVDARFLGNVMSGDTVQATGTRNAGRYQADLTNSNGALLVTASVVIAMEAP